MPTAIDEEKLATMKVLDMSKPQGYAQGLPVKHIPHQEYPRCVYRHPVQAYREVLHRNVNHEIVDRELVATEHLVHVCHSEQEHKQKLSEGWFEEPYIPQAPPNPTEHLYTKVTDEVLKRIGGQPAPATTSQPASGGDLDLVAAQKFLQSRGYTCESPEAAADFVEKLTAKERKGFLKELAEYVPVEGDGK